MSIFALREALASVALSHDQDCGCGTCKAAGGDHEALMRIVIAMDDTAIQR
jgi:hypothetical protein